MPNCRICGAFYPREFFIGGVGHRKDVCVRCGLEKGMVTKDEVPAYFSVSTSNARLNLLTRRWSPWLWLLTIWGFWFVIPSSGIFWWISLVTLLLLSLFLPLYHFLKTPHYNAMMALITPEFERPPGH